MMIQGSEESDASKILAGAGINDDDDSEMTLNSIKSAERAVGGKMLTPKTDKGQYM